MTTKKEDKKTYHVLFEKKPELQKDPLKIEIFVKLTPEQKKYFEKNQLQINEQKIIQYKGKSIAKLIGYTFLIKDFMKETDKNIKEDIKIIHKDEADRAILKRYIEQFILQANGQVEADKEIAEEYKKKMQK